MRGILRFIKHTMGLSGEIIPDIYRDVAVEIHGMTVLCTDYIKRMIGISS